MGKRQRMKRFLRYVVLFFLFFRCALIFPQVIAVVGDFENTPMQVDSVSMLVKSWNPDLVVTSGDNFDAFYGTVDDLVGAYYNDYIYPYVGIYGTGAATNKFYPALGNHEMNADGLTQFVNFFTLPGVERYYSVHLGNISFFILNSNASEHAGVTDTSMQALWLQNALALAGNDWKIVVCHHPPYTSGPHPSTTYMQWPFDTWGADAVISGHNHFYERLYSNGVSYFVNGCGGAVLYSYSTLIPESQFLYNKLWGAIKIEPYTDSLVFNFYTIRDSLIDRYVIYKNPVGGFADVVQLQAGVFQDNVYLTLNGIVNDPVNVEIFDATGKQVFVRKNIIPVNNICSVNISSLVGGMYVVRVSNNLFDGTAKFLIGY
jgi:tartrate-resistant acid phosphatase type 5